MAKSDAEALLRYADMFAALGSGARLRILRLLLALHPQGMAAGEVQAELGIPASTLSHHLEKLKNQGLVTVRRKGTFLWYSANTEALQDLLAFLLGECCKRSKALKPEVIIRLCR